MAKQTETKPVLFFPSKSKDKKDLRLFLRSHKYIRIVDAYQSMLEEVCAIRHPQLRRDPVQLKKTQKKFVKEHVQGCALEDVGTWVYFPWIQTLVHFLEEELHEELRTARNRNLITVDEQKKYRECNVAVAGLSVGSHAAVSIALQGGGHEMRLADFDTISGTNLNRIRAGFQTVDQKKATVVAQEIFEMNPYTKLRLFPHGARPQDMKAFLHAPKPAQVIIEEIDHVPTKFLLREEARRLQIPLISATDNGDGILLDIERYDLDPETPFFNGRATGITVEKFEKASPQELVQMMAQLIGAEDVTKRMMASALEMGKTVYSWPQLGGAAQMAGVALAYAVRMIATGGPLKSGRTIISFEKLLSFNTLV